MEQRAARVVTVTLYGAAAVGILWLTVRFILPWTAPFLVAFGAAALLEPGVRALVRRGWRRGLAAGMITVLVLALLTALCVWLVSRGISAVTDFAKQAPAVMQGAGETLNRLERAASEYVRTAPPAVSGYLETAMSSAAETLYRLPGEFSQRALDMAARAAQNSPGSVLFLITAAIGTYFLSASFPRTVAFIKAQLPRRLTERLDGLGGDLKQSFGGWLRAQLILMVMTFGELTAAFLLLRVRNAVGMAALTAVVDALPVFGTGIILGPWAIYAGLMGQFGLAVGLVISWCTVNLVRNAAQAKLLGDQIGLDPAVSLLSIYVGWQVWGVGGMLVFPILFVTLRQLNDKGVIKLWKEI